MSQSWLQGFTIRQNLELAPRALVSNLWEDLGAYPKEVLNQQGGGGGLLIFLRNQGQILV